MPSAVLADAVASNTADALANDFAPSESAPIAASDDELDDEDEDGDYAMLDASDEESEDNDNLDPTSIGAPTSSSTTATTAENIPLWLPSQLPVALRCEDSLQHLARSEVRLREAQANDALAEIRRLRRILTGISLYKHLTLDGTGGRTSTRILSTYRSFQVKVQRCTDRYRASYRALLVLDPNGPWRARLKELKRKDVRGPGLEEGEDRRGEGARQPSWIWLVAGVSPSEQDCDVKGNEFMEGVRVEWARVRARAKRWGEEKLQLQEEMRRVVVFLEWKRQWWLDQASRRQGLPSGLQHGLACYAGMQADVYGSLAVKFAGLWLPLLKSYDISPSWGVAYPQPTDATLPITPTDGSSAVGGNRDDSAGDSDTEDSDDDDANDDRQWNDTSDCDSHDGRNITQRQGSFEEDITFELGGDTP